MKSTRTILVILAVLLVAAVVPAAAQARKPYTFTVFDEFMQPVTQAVTYTIYNGDGGADITATCYTTPTGATAADFTNVTGGSIQFWSTAEYVDITAVNDAMANATRTYDLYPYEHRLMLSQHVGVLGATTYTGALIGVGSTWTGNMLLGSTGAGVDATFWGTTAGDFLKWDMSEDYLFFEDTDCVLNEGATLIFYDSGNAADWTVKCSTGEKLEFLPTEITDDQVFAVGDANHTSDLLWYTKTASSIINIDASGDLMFFDGVDVRLNDDDVLSFGDAAEATIQYDEDGNNDLQITGTVGFDGAVNFGINDTGVDVIFFGATDGAYAKWDQANDRMIFTGASLYMNDDTCLRFGAGGDVTIEYDEDGTDTLQIAGTASVRSTVNWVFTGNVDLGNAVGDAINMIGTATTTNKGVGFVTNTSKTHKYAYGGIGYVGATSISCTGWASADGLASTGLAAGVAESFAAEGYTMIDDAADYLLFSMKIPPLFVDDGNATDLMIEFDLEEQAAEECNLDVRIFVYGNTTPIVTDTIVIANAAARAWSPLVTLATGFGAVANLTADSILLIEVTSTADADDVDVYGVRLKYNVGVECTQ